MSDSERKICRYFNTFGGCWFADKCKYLHIPDKKPPCKFFGSVNGCRFGDNCHFSHDRSPFKSVENIEEKVKENGDGKETQEFKENVDPGELSGTNNNNMDQATICTTEVTENTENQTETPKDLNEVEVHCGACKHSLKRQNAESYCNLLKDHYLECFLEKDGDHVKAVKIKSAMDPGQMYWCKTCILIFEKPWSLFQHMADKAKGTKVQRWDKKIHLDWLDTVAGLLAGHDLGLFSPGKLRSDLRNLLADQQSVEEELEAAAAAATTAALVQLLNPPAAPWRIQQRDIMRRIEQLNRQVLKKCQKGTRPANLTGGVRQLSLTSSLASPLAQAAIGAPASLSAVAASTLAASNPPPASTGVEKETGAGGDTCLNNATNESGGSSASSSCGGNVGSLANSSFVATAAAVVGGQTGAGLDLTCGFTEDEVNELLSQGIKPWDEEAPTALAVLRGELDYLLE